jgi:hypothetical protein
MSEMISSTGVPAPPSASANARASASGGGSPSKATDCENGLPGPSAEQVNTRCAGMSRTTSSATVLNTSAKSLVRVAVVTTRLIISIWLFLDSTSCVSRTLSEMSLAMLSIATGSPIEFLIRVVLRLIWTSAPPSVTHVTSKSWSHCCSLILLIQTMKRPMSFSTSHG